MRMGSRPENNLRNILITIFFIVFTMSLFALVKDPAIIANVIMSLSGEDDQYDPSVVINLTFDDPDSPWKDYSHLNHQFTANGDLSWADRDVCKWYGCADMTATSGDYLSSSANYNLTEGSMAVSYWIYFDTKPGDSNPQGIFQIGEGGNIKRTQYSTYCFNPSWRANLGEISTNTYSSGCVNADAWYFVFEQYDNESGKYDLWLNGADYHLNSDEPFGALNYASEELIVLGRLGSSDVEGYLDEFVIWSRGNFTEDEIIQMYDAKRLGTPPVKDMFVKNIKYTLPRDWDSEDNLLDVSGSMPIYYDIVNQGTESTGSFDVKFYLDDSLICSHRIQLDAREQQNLTCSWPKSYGYHIGYISVDSSSEIDEDYESNNIQKVYIPFLDRPYMLFNLTEWTNILKPYCTDPSNEIAYDSCDRYKNFVSEDFMQYWDGNDVDPRGKKGRESAMTCMFNNYDMGTMQCQRAMNHLFGWGNRSLDTYDNVQSIHELSHVGFTYDIMFPVLTQEDHELLSKQYHDVCQQITNLDNVRPDNDQEGLIQGGNGWGFGSGMASFCYSVVGEYAENPTMIQDTDQQYWGKNIPDEWMDREVAYLSAYKNDSWAKYQEGWLYKFYGQFHMVENLWFEKRFSLNNIDDFQNALCSMGKELITDTLDFNYEGDSLRNDHSRSLRGVQRGDSNSYEDPGSESIIQYAIADYYGALCDDMEVKESILSWRTSTYNIGDNRYSIPEMYIYKQLREQAEPESPEQSMPKTIFDNANDILTIRTNYTYVNDTLIQIDGGEERGGGHSQAQGYYLYALGEPFLDYEQVPYEDDVRAETWKNGISLQNTSQTVEGTGGTYSQACGNAPLNQYYGMSDCEPAIYPEDYPDYRRFPLEYGGDLEDYLGTDDARLSGVYVWRPYKDADPVKEYFVKFGDMLAKRTVVSGNLQAEGIYHNFINIYDEFQETRSGPNLTFTRTGQNKNLAIQLVDSDADFTLGGGDSGIRYCFAKTDCSGSNAGLGNYRRTYLYTPSDDADFILSHHWYYSGQYEPVSSITGIDSGVMQGTRHIVFDTDGDGNSTHGTKNSRAWALAYDDTTGEIAAFNTTFIEDSGIPVFESSSDVSVYLARGLESIVVSINTMDRDAYIDKPREVQVTIDAGSLENNSDFEVTKKGVPISISTDGTKITFYAISGQNSDTYVITGNSFTEDFTSPFISGVSNTSITDDSFKISLQLNESANATLAYSQDFLLENPSYITRPQYFASHIFSLSSLESNTTYYWQITGSDMRGNSYSTAIYNTTTLEPEIDMSQPDITLLDVGSISDSAFTLTVILNESANATVHYSESSEMAGSLEDKDSSYSISHSFSISGLSPETTYYWIVEGHDESGNSYVSNISEITTVMEVLNRPNASTFDGKTTDFASLTEFDSIDNMTLESSSFGMLMFPGTVDVEGYDLDSNIMMRYASVSIDSSQLPNLNRSATIIFYGLNLIDPKIMKDGAECNEECVISSYVSGNLTFSVVGFSTYSAVEGYIEPVEVSSSGSSGGGSGGGSSSGYIRPVPEDVEENVIESEEPVLEEPSQNITEPAKTIKDEEPKEEKPEKIEKKKDKRFPVLILLGLGLIIGGIGYLYYLKREEISSYADAEVVPDEESYTTEEEPETHMIHKKSGKPLEISDDKKATNLYELAAHIADMQDTDFEQMSESMARWVEESLDHPDLASLLRSSKSKDDAYRILYNIYASYSGEEEVYHINDALLNTDFNDLSVSPLVVRGGLPVFTLNNLSTLLPMLDEKEFEAYRPHIHGWSEQFGEHISHILKSAGTKDEMISFIETIKREQEIYKISRKRGL